MSKAVNLANDIVYSTPKEDRENKKDFKPRTKNFEGKRNENFEGKRNERTFGDEQRITETKSSVDIDSDGFEIIGEKKQGEKKKPYRKREFENNGNGEKKRFNWKENGEERPATAVKRAAAPVETAKPKPAVNANLNKVTVLENVRKKFFFLFLVFLKMFFLYGKFFVFENVYLFVLFFINCLFNVGLLIFIFFIVRF